MAEIDVKFIRGWRAEVGMLAPMPFMYREWDTITPPGVRFTQAIVGLSRTTPEGLREMASRIETEAEKLNIGHTCDLICLGCTSGSFVGGPGYDDELISKIEKASGSPGTTTTTCVGEILKDMGIKKMALVGPYTDTVFDIEVEYFKNKGIDAIYVKGSGLGLVEQWEFYECMMNPLCSYKLIKDGAKAVPDADCVFATCMCMPLLEIADVIEKEIGKPVITSQSATLYGILKKLRIPDPVYHYGEALTRPRV